MQDAGIMGTEINRYPIYNTPQTEQPIPWSEKTLDIKLARKVSKRSKRDLRGLRETLAPGSTVMRTSPTTTVIKEPGVPEVRVRNNDIAKFETRAQRKTDIWQYAQRRPLPYEKTAEEKIAQRTKDLKKKHRGKSKFDTDPPSPMLLQESCLLTATFLRPCLLVNPKCLKREEIDRGNPRAR